MHLRPGVAFVISRREGEVGGDTGSRILNELLPLNPSCPHRCPGRHGKCKGVEGQGGWKSVP